MKIPRLLPIVLAAVLLAGVGCRKEDPAPDPAPAPEDPDTTAHHVPPPYDPTPYQLVLPTNLPPMSFPPDNPLTVAGVRLGRYLFYEERLSGDNTMSCSTCHAPALAFTDGHAVSTGIDGIAGTRSAMPLMNLGYSSFFFWDGRAATLEEQILQPVPNPIEMHQTWPATMAKLQADTAYTDLFHAAFGTETVDSLLVAKALAQFLRTLVTGNSDFDKAIRFEGVMTPEAQQGYQLFQLEGGAVGQIIPVAGSTPVVGQGGADCFHCHSPGGNLFTDEQFHNNGLDVTFADPGRGGVTGDPYDEGKFKTPTLRNIMLTAPYMHDGRFATIDEVLDHYNDGGHASLTVDPFMKFTDPEETLGLTPEKRAQIKAFLNALTDMDFVTDPAFQDPGPP